MGCWLGLRAYQTFNKELDFIVFMLWKKLRKIRIIILKHFERNFARNCVKEWNFIFKVIMKWTVWNALSQSHWGTVSLKYSQSIKIHIGPSGGGAIVLSTYCPTVSYWRLLDLRWNRKSAKSLDLYFYNSRVKCSYNFSPQNNI